MCLKSGLCFGFTTPSTFFLSYLQDVVVQKGEGVPDNPQKACKVQ